MPIQRRQNMWFGIMLFGFFAVGYGLLTGAVAGQEGPCSTNIPTGRIVWVWQPVPRFKCVTGYGR